MSNDTLLTWKSQIQVRQVKDWIKAADKASLIKFLQERFTERYFDPLRCASNGFLLMGVSCLIIEAMESYRQGWPDSDRLGSRPFSSFFARSHLFGVFQPAASEFYKHIRCGILHQGETTGGWTITQKDTAALFDVAQKRVNAAQFHKTLEQELANYLAELNAAGITDELWINCIFKMHSTIKNCD